MNRPSRDWSRFALVLIDFQHDFWPAPLAAQFPDLPANLERLLAPAARGEPRSSTSAPRSGRTAPHRDLATTRWHARRDHGRRDQPHGPDRSELAGAPMHFCGYPEAESRRFVEEAGLRVESAQPESPEHRITRRQVAPAERASFLWLVATKPDG